VFFGNSLEMTKSRPDQLPAQILKLMNRGAERKVYIRADAHAKYARIREVLDGVRSAGVESVSFLINERKAVTPIQ
jgi:biopolymer transport protein ExbD